MRRALELAERGWGRVSPNPMVGALVVDDRDGAVARRRAGMKGPAPTHAEVMALATAGDRARGATVVCTLEPCNRFGSTPPCTRALIDAGVAQGRGRRDRSGPGRRRARPRRAPRGRHRGRDRRARRAESRRLNRAFDRHVTTRSPDGHPEDGLEPGRQDGGEPTVRPEWITGEEARADVQRLRAWADAVVVGAGTADRRRSRRSPCATRGSRRRARRCGSWSTRPAGCPPAGRSSTGRRPR